LRRPPVARDAGGADATRAQDRLCVAIAAALIAALGFLVAPKSGAEGNKDKGKPTRADFALK
jgi:hypothetical protein